MFGNFSILKFSDRGVDKITDGRDFEPLLFPYSSGIELLVQVETQRLGNELRVRGASCVQNLFKRALRLRWIAPS